LDRLAIRSPTGNALGRVSDNRFDELNRLTRSIQDADDSDPGTVNIAATVIYGFDAVDNLRQVIDPNQLVTEYTYDGLNNLTRLTSPDTGITDYTHDDAGNRITQTDARGVVTTYVYDASSRLTDILYPAAPAKNVSFSYDANPSECGPDERHGQGRLAEMRDASGHTRHCYDPRGNLTAKHQRIDGRDLVTRYRYNHADRLMAVVYPSGFELQLTRDPLGRIASAVLDTGSQSYPIVADLSHLPFGPISAYPFADGSTLSKTWDLNYWPDAVSSNALDYDYSTDDVGNITAIDSAIENPRQYDYDRLDRLSEVRDQNQALIESYAFDPTGNRTARTKDGATEQLSYTNTPAAPIFPTDPTYADFSHRLQSVDVTPRTYDDVGNTLTGIPELNAQSATSEYDERNRLTRIHSGGIELARYEYNGRGERVAKQTADEAYFYAYDESGQLIGRYVPEGATDWRIDEEILWLDSTPIASVRIDNGQPVIRAIHSDHLNSPRALTSLHGDTQPQGTTVWRWPLTTGDAGGNNAYGTEQALEDPDGDGTAVVFHLRFPGQQYDGESGLHYNYFRDYEAGIGRYVESDPIGLRGGFSTFTYAGNSPKARTDPRGLYSFDKSCDSCALGTDFANRLSAAADIACSTVLSLSSSISDFQLSSCMARRCLDDQFKIACDGRDCYDFENLSIRSRQGYYGPKYGLDSTVNEWRLEFPSEIVLCTYTRESNLFYDQGVWATTIIHETAHSCGWEHGMGMGVPMDPPGFNLESIANKKTGPPWGYWGRHLQ
jgi:RHS repeat-associated protein